MKVKYIDCSVFKGSFSNPKDAQKYMIEVICPLLGSNYYSGYALECVRTGKGSVYINAAGHIWGSEAAYWEGSKELVIPSKLKYRNYKE